MWYRTGTITVTANSATVTGSGTAWVENARVGDGLQGPDGRLYEITNIASNTALSITPAYQGSTASGQAYWIIPVQGYVKKSADRLAAITDELADIPGRVTQNEDDIVSAEQAISANSQAIDGVEQGLSTLELAALLKSGNLSGLADLKQSQLNLGVIQSLTGEVLNTDNCTVITNANGTAWRFPNGLQICFFIGRVPGISVPDAYVNGLYTGDISWTFPAPFRLNPAAFGSVRWGTSASWVCLYATSPTECNGKVIDGAKRLTGDSYQFWIAAGNW